ncbi:MAG: RNA-binding protein [Geobacteraceae bacterium]|nr:RNA-binding protein [Geobacteraceae bacterium]
MAKEIYVGHISENATEEDVWKLFSVMGTVTSVHLIIDPETGEFKRCGYVRMAAGISLEEVVETLDGTYLIDREIVVSIARPQKPGMSKSGGNKQPWMKSGPKPEAKPGTKPSARPRPKTGATPEQRDKPARAAKPGAKPAARSEARPFQGKRPGGAARTPRPRSTK